MTEDERLTRARIRLENAKMMEEANRRALTRATEQRRQAETNFDQVMEEIAGQDELPFG